MEELNEEKFNENEQPISNQEGTPTEEVVTNEVESAAEETTVVEEPAAEEPVAEETTETEEAAAVAEPITEEPVVAEPEETVVEAEPETCECSNENSCTTKAPKKCKIGIIIAAIVAALVIVVIVLACLGKFSKYPGFKKDRHTGIYYKFYGDIHDTADMPKTGDLVGFLFSLRAGDSTLIPMMPNEMIMDSIYEGDFYGALRMMHVGDSATFVFNGKDFFQHFMQNTEYPFGDDPLYMDIMLYGQMSKVDFEKARAEYETSMKQKEAEEGEQILKYVKEHNIKAQPTAEGLYLITNKKGNGAQPQDAQTVTVHYTGKLLDGTIFDSSVERGEPFSFVLGSHQVIPGWEIALSQMHVGEKATVIIPSKLAYGERGNYGIPPFSTLVFDIELLSIQ